MKLFTKAHVTQAYLKAGVLGFAGSGKTFTSSRLAIGLVKMMRSLKLPEGDRPVLFIDTETGVDWVKPMFDAEGIDLFTAKTRAFSDLCQAVRDAQDGGAVLIIDSITHFWRELCDAYAKKKQRRSLQFQDWAVLKATWGEFTDLYVNSRAHIIICGRAGYEYDMETDEDTGKKELLKTGVKMKAETETGFEPSLLVLMERQQRLESGKVAETFRTATVLKDRSALLDGAVFEFRPSDKMDAVFEAFRPHIERLALGGEQLGVDTTRNSENLFDDQGRPDWQRERQEKALVLDEVRELLLKHFPSQSADDKAKKAEALEIHFGTRSWKRIEEDHRAFPLPRVQQAFNDLHMALEGRPAYEAPEPKSDSDGERGPTFFSLMSMAEAAKTKTDIDDVRDLARRLPKTDKQSVLDKCDELAGRLPE